MSTTGTLMRSSGSSLFGNSKGPVYDNYAVDWFAKMAAITEQRVLGYIEKHGEPEDYHDAFYTFKQGSLGLEVGIHARKEENGALVYSFHLRANKHKYEKWAREHSYLMEGFMTFRIGPVIVAHPGRPRDTVRIAGKERPRPINIWEVEFGFLKEEGTDWFNLLNGTVMVAVTRNTIPDGPNSPEWLVHRVR